MYSYLFLPYKIQLFVGETALTIHSGEIGFIHVLTGIASVGTQTLHTMDICALPTLSETYQETVTGEATIALITVEKSFIASCNDFIPFYMELNSAKDQNHSYMRLNALFNALQKDYFSVPQVSLERLQTNIRDCVFEILNHFSIKTRPQPSKKSHLIYLVEHNYAKNLSLNTLAEEMNITPQYISVYSRQLFGMPLTTYLSHKRARAASYYLTHTDDTITQIADRCGFSNFNSFNQAFKAQFGMSASKYRSGHKKEPLPYFIAEHPDYLANRALYWEKCPQDTPEAGSLNLYRKNLCSATINIHQQTYPYLPTQLPPVDIMHLSLPDNVLPATILEHLRYIRQSIPLKYMRINGLLDSGEYDPVNKTYYFRSSEELLVNLIHLDIHPIISFIIDPDSDVVERFAAFFRHILQTFGLQRIRHWQFEYTALNTLRANTSPSLQDIRKTAKCMLDITQIVKATALDIPIGTGIFNSNFPTTACEMLLSALSASGISPDFYSLQLYASNLTKQSLDLRAGGDYSLSTNRYVIYQKIKTYRGIIEQIFGENHGHIYAQICLTLQKSNILNESLFSATFLLMNILKSQHLVDHYILPIPDDSCHFTYRPNTHIHHGIYSLLTDRGLPKPLFFAMKLLCDCGHLQIASSDTHLISVDSSNRLTILIFNHVQPDIFYCNHPKQLSPKDLYAIFPQASAKLFNIALSPAKASSYFVEEWLLNRENGSIFDLWLGSNNAAALPLDTISTLQNQVHPKYRYYILKTEKDTITLKEQLQAHEIKLIRLTPQINQEMCVS